jgi:methionyl-tRNA synthetase
MKEKINFETFKGIEKQLEIKLGTIQSVDRIPKSDKMLKLTVFFGEGDQRTVVTNIGNRLENINELMFITLPFITNLEPVKIMGVESTAMIMPPTVGESIKLDGIPGSVLM